MSQTSRRGRLVYLLLVVLLGIAAVNLVVDRVGQALAEPDPLRAAWRRAHDAGTYHFSAAIYETLSPRPTAANAGQTGVAYALGVEGDVDGPFRSRARLAPLDAPGTMAAFSQPAEIVTWGDEIYARRVGDAWQRVDANPAAIASAQTDYLAFLNAATDVRDLGVEQVDGALYRRYGFRVDGPQYARYVAEQLARANPDPLAETRFVVPPQFRDVQGSGELWVGEADGLPHRQLLDVHFPDPDPAYLLDVHLEADFSGYGQSLSAPIVRPATGTTTGGDWPSELANQQISEPASHRVTESPSHRTTEPLSRRIPESTNLQIYQSTDQSTDYLAALLILLIFLGAWKLRRRRQLIYAVIVIFVTASMITSPILRGFRPGLRRAHAVPIAEVLADPVASSQMSVVSNQPESQLTQHAPPSTTFRGPGTRNTNSTTDSDGDGLTDEMETLLGTYLLDEDSDLDGLTDKQEADGFEFGGDTYYTNPLWPDTNHDGLSDGAELSFPDPVTPTLDLDNDGTANVFDRDNDDDGVMDAIDISPWSRSGTYGKATPFGFEIERYGGGAVPVYMMIQLRPTGAGHLRYLNGKFDWPSDPVGQIQDEDGSRDDMTLIPMLEVSADWAMDWSSLSLLYSMSPSDRDLDNYGINADHEAHTLHVPLSPLRDNGDVVGFHGKIYYPADTASWATAVSGRRFIGGDVRLVWLLTFTDDDGNNSVIAQYYEDFYLTGFTVEEEHGMDVAQLYDNTTPVLDDAIDPARMIQTLIHLEQTYIHGGEPSIDAFTTTLQSTWGFTTVEVLHHSYAHLDEALATTTQTTTKQILDSFPVITDGLTVPILYVYEQSSAVRSLDHAADGALTVNGDLIFNMGDALGPVVERGMKLGWYNTESYDLLGADAIVGVVNRYHDEWTSGEDLEAQINIKFLLGSWASGNERIVRVGDVEIPYVSAEPTETAKEAQPVKDGWDALKSIAKCFKKDKTTGEWTHKQLGLTISVIGIKILLQETGWGKTEIPVGAVAGELNPSWSNWTVSVDDAFDGALGAYDVYNKFAKIGKIQGGMKGLFGPIEQSGMSKSLGYIGLVVQVGLIWYSFFTATSDMDRSSPQYKFARAYAVAQTIIAAALFLLAMTGIGVIIVAIFALISFIAWLFGYDLESELARWLAGLLYHIDELTTIPDDGVQFGGIDFDIDWSTTSGVVQGNELIYTLPVTSTIVNTKHGSKGDVQASYYKVTLDAMTTFPWDHIWSAEGSYQCSIKSENVAVDWAPDWTQHTETCVQRPEVHIRFGLAMPNQDLHLDYISRYKLFYQECEYGFCERKATTGADGNVLDTTYFDVLPATLADLWDWDFGFYLATPHTWNRDPDGDGLRDESWTSATDWDSDDDGLSDRYERAAADRPVPIDLDPWSGDSDGDGLNDALELDFGSDPGKRDTDGDGLSDKLEYEGWMMTLSTGEGSLTTRAWPDPNQPDADADNLSDLAEYHRRSNPNGYTVNLSLRQTAQPILDTDWPPVVRSGQWLTFTADYLHGAPLTMTQMAFTSTLPSQLLDIGHGESASGGPHTPTLQSVLPYWWAVDQLVADQGFAVTLTGQVSPTFAGSGLVTHTVYAEALYAAAPISGTSYAYALIDNDDPTCAAKAPAGGSFIKGSSIIFGGDASDPTSWVDHVEGRVYRGGYNTDWGPVTNTTAWAYAWTIPAPKAGDGTYTVTCRATDVMDHQAEGSSITVTVDNTPPTSTIENLVGGQAISATIAYRTDTWEEYTWQVPTGAIITVTGSAADNDAGADRVSGVNNVVFSDDAGAGFQTVDNMTPTVDSGGGVTWTHVWRLPTWNFEGCYTLTTQATDNIGNVEPPTTGITITIDNTPPASDFYVELGGAVDDSFISGTVVITGHSYDVSSHLWGHFEEDYCRAGVQDVQIQVWRDVYNAARTAYTPTLVLDWASVDAIGQVGAYTTTYTATWTPSQDGMYHVYVRGTDRAANLETFTTTLDYVMYAGGGQVLGSTERIYNADVTSPIVQLVTPISGSLVSNAVVLITGTAQDGVDGLGLDTVADPVQVSLDGGITWEPFTATIVEQTGRATWRWFHYFEPSSDGVYTLTARARDVVNNLGPAATPITFEVDTAGPMAWITNLRPGDIVSDSTGDGEFIVQGVAHSTGFAVAGVNVQVDQGSAVSATAAPNWATWVYTWTLPAGGEHGLRTISWDTGLPPNYQTVTQTEESAITVTVDTNDPLIALGYPSGWSGVVTGTTWILSGTVSDSETWIQAVHVQTDTAAPWRAADLTVITSGMPITYWSYTWAVPELDWVTRAVRVRAADAAGNVTTTLLTPNEVLTPSLYVDNVPPINPITVTTNLTAGFWYTDNSVKPQVNWSGAYDGGGITGYEMRWDPDPNWTLSSGDSSQAPGFAEYEKSFHLRTVDRAGNQAAELLVGPFRYDTVKTPSVAIVDGAIELDRQEWLPGEQMGVDTRPAFGDLVHYATWGEAYQSQGGAYLFLAFDGASWNGDGDLFIYFDTDPGVSSDGCPTTWDYGGYGTHTLPPFDMVTLKEAFKADYVFYVEDSTTGGMMYNTSGTLGGWLTKTTSVSTTFAHQGDQTEMRILWSDLGLDLNDDFEMLAFVQTETTSEVLAAFPNTNDLSGAFTARYELALMDDRRPNTDQPQAYSLALSGQAQPNGAVGRNAPVTYALRYENLGSLDIGDVVRISVTIPSNLSATCDDISADVAPGLSIQDVGNGVCVVPVSQEGEFYAYYLPAGASGAITLSGTIKDAAPTGPVTVTGYIKGDRPDRPDIDDTDNWTRPSVLVDATPPTAGFIPFGGQSQIYRFTDYQSTNQVTYVGPNTVIAGVAQDNRAGVARVELDRDDGNGFQSINGTVVWGGAGVSGSDGEARTLRVRATDAMGNVGEATSLQVVLDLSAPTSAIANPPYGEVIPADSDVTITGTVSDPSTGFASASRSVAERTGQASGVAWVQLGMDDGDGTIWLPTQLRGDVWSYEWTFEVTGTYTLTVRAADNVGNVETPGEAVVVAVGPDTVGPYLVMTSPGEGALLSGASATLQGAASDFSGVAWVQVSTGGGDSWTAASGTTNWSYVWTLPAEDGVAHTLLARSQDSLGNPAQTTGRTVTVDTVAPGSSIGNLTSGQVLSGTAYLITGAASDGHSVALVEISTDGGDSWTAASGTSAWSYNWTLPANGTYTVTTRATDLAGNVETPGEGVTVQIANGYSIFLPLVLRE